MAQEHSVRVSARGEFGQLERGLKNLQKDLAGVLGEIDKGARQGGVFDDRQLRALDLFRGRFRQTSDDIQREFDRHTQIIDQLNRKLQQASEDEKKRIREEINERRKKIDILRREYEELQKLYGQRNNEAGNFGNRGLDINALNEKTSKSLLGRLGSKLMDGAKGALALAGIGGFGTILAQAYQEAYQREVNSLDLAQRIRGSVFRGSATNIYDIVSATGRRSGMGYTQAESWQLQEAYSQKAGILSPEQQYALQRFSRGYGLDATQVGATVAGVRQLGGTATPKEFADMIAGSVEQSGMTPRILEVMETSAGLLSAINTTLKDGNAKELLAYQTTLDRIGNEKGMMKLTGQQGANIIGGLGGIFTPQADRWKWMGIRALQQYNPEKYGKMDLFNLEMAFEDSLNNVDNVGAMARYIKSISKGNKQIELRLLQKWLQDGGYNATKRQVSELYDATNGLTAFDPVKMQGVINSIQNGDSGAKYGERAGAPGQEILATEAQYKKSLEQIGSEFLGAITTLKAGVATALDNVAIKLKDFEKPVDKFAEAVNKFVDGLPKPIKDKIRDAIDWGIDNPLAVMTGYAVGKPIVTNLWNRLRGRGGASPGGASPGGTPPVDILPDGPSVRPSMWSRFRSWFAETRIGQNIRVFRDFGKLGFNVLKDNAPELLKSTASKLAKPAMVGLGIYSLKDRYNEYREAGAGRLQAGWNSVLDLLGFPKASGEELIKRRNEIMQENGWENTLWNRMKAMEQAEEEMNQNLRGFSKEGTLAIENLSKEGQLELIKLEERGLLKLGNLDKEGRLHIEGLSKDGLLKLQQLEKSGDLHLSNMSKNTKEKMEAIYEEHKGFKEYFGGLWKDFLNLLPSWIADKLPGGGDIASRGQSGNVNKNYNITNDSGITGAQLNAKLGGVLKGKGDFIARVARERGIDPAFLASLMMLESANGTSELARTQNNPGGMTNPKTGGFATYGSIEKGIIAVADNLKYYIKRGWDTIEEVHSRWAPINASNDPNGLNKGWSDGIIRYMNEFGVSTYANSGTSFFSGWEKRYKGGAGAFGAPRDGGKRTHEGIDISGKQGQFIDALMSGQVVWIDMDDGGKWDKDKKANSKKGGTEITIKIPATGETYSYSHLSNINPELLNRYFVKGERNIPVNTGDYIGNIGGTPGVPGSGNSTSGPHLHFTYTDAQGRKLDGRQFIKEMLMSQNLKFESGDSDTDFSKIALQNGLTSEVKQTIDVNVKISGDGSIKLDAISTLMLENIIRSVFEKIAKEKVQLNPAITGYPS